MTRAIHYEVEILADTLSQPLCQNAAGRDAFNGKPVEMTTDDAQVTCRKCSEALGYAVPSTVVPFSPMRFKTLDDGREQVAA